MLPLPIVLSLGRSRAFSAAVHPASVGVTFSAMPITRDQELWGMALWVEKHHGENGWLYVAQQQDRLLAEGDLEGMAMWREVANRFDQLMVRKSGN